MTANAHELGATVGAWNAVIRRARIGRERKAAALVLSSYARADGTHIHCGVARLAVDLEVSYSTARRELAWLRKVGLIELVRAGNRRRNLSDEYRLILGPNVLEHLDVLDPAEHKNLTDGVREANRTGVRGRATKADQRSSEVSAETVQAPNDHGSSRVSAETAISAQIGVDQRSPMDELPSLRYISPKDLSPRQTTDDGALRAQPTLGAAPESEPSESSRIVEIFPGASQEAPYRPPPTSRRWSRGVDLVAEATARRAAAVAAHHARLASGETT